MQRRLVLGEHGDLGTSTALVVATVRMEAVGGRVEALAVRVGERMASLGRELARGHLKVFAADRINVELGGVLGSVNGFGAGLVEERVDLDDRQIFG